MAHFRYKIDKKKGLNIVCIRYGQGCQCSWLNMELRVPLDTNADHYIRKVLDNL